MVMAPPEDHLFPSSWPATGTAGHDEGSVRGQLVLGLGIEVAGVVAFVQLLRGFPLQTVDHAAALHCRACIDRVSPANNVLVLVCRQELGPAIRIELDQP